MISEPSNIVEQATSKNFSEDAGISEASRNVEESVKFRKIFVKYLNKYGTDFSFIKIEKLFENLSDEDLNEIYRDYMDFKSQFLNTSLSKSRISRIEKISERVVTDIIEDQDTVKRSTDEEENQDNRNNPINQNEAGIKSGGIENTEKSQAENTIRTGLPKDNDGEVRNKSISYKAVVLYDGKRKIQAKANLEMEDRRLPFLLKDYEIRLKQQLSYVYEMYSILVEEGLIEEGFLNDELYYTDTSFKRMNYKSKKMIEKSGLKGFKRESPRKVQNEQSIDYKLNYESPTKIINEFENKADMLFNSIKMENIKSNIKTVSMPDLESKSIEYGKESEPDICVQALINAPENSIATENNEPNTVVLESSSSCIIEKTDDSCMMIEPENDSNKNDAGVNNSSILIITNPDAHDKPMTANEDPIVVSDENPPSDVLKSEFKRRQLEDRCSPLKSDILYGYNDYLNDFISGTEHPNKKFKTEVNAETSKQEINSEFNKGKQIIGSKLREQDNSAENDRLVVTSDINEQDNSADNNYPIMDNRLDKQDNSDKINQNITALYKNDLFDDKNDKYPINTDKLTTNDTKKPDIIEPNISDKYPINTDTLTTNDTKKQDIIEPNISDKSDVNQTPELCSISNKENIKSQGLNVESSKKRQPCRVSAVLKPDILMNSVSRNPNNTQSTTKPSAQISDHANAEAAEDLISQYLSQ